MASATQQLTIRRVYSSHPVKAAAIATGRTRTARVSVLGVLSLLVAGAWFYSIWWPVDRWIVHSSMMAWFNLPGAADALNLSNLFGEAPADLANPAPPEGDTSSQVAAADANTIDEIESDDQTNSTARADDDTAPGDVAATTSEDFAEQEERVMGAVGASAVGWMTLATVVACWIALCGGSAAASTPMTNPALRRPAVLAALIAWLAAAWIGRQLWQGATIDDGLPKWTLEAGLVLLAVAGCWLIASNVSGRTAFLLSMLLLVAMCGGGYWAYQQYELGYPAVAPRLAAVVGMAAAACLGASMPRKSIGLHKVAVALAVIAAIGSVGVLQYLSGFNVIREPALDAGLYAKVVAAQAGYAVAIAGALSLRVR